MSAVPLTGPGGEFSVSEEAQKILCYMSDGRLYIGKQHRWNPQVSSLVARLERMGRQHLIEQVDLNFIAELYRKSSSQQQDAAKHSDMQKDVVDLCSQAVSRRASDIHIRVSERAGTKIYFRIHNDLELVREEPAEYGPRLCTTIYQSMADVGDATIQMMSRQDARISDPTKLPKGIMGIRIATSPQVGGSIMVMRLLYDDVGDGKGIKDLGFAEQTLHALELMTRRPTGINIIAGPTGAGKSTTLQRVLTKLIKDTHGTKHVITIEDPPEYPIGDAVQTPVTNCETEEERSKAFQAAIKATMRLDPDVIMIGEIRDTASARLAVQAAMTGHQVWTTVHANSALAILDRLIDLGVPSTLVYDSEIVTGLTCQRLLKVLCPECKVPFKEKMANYHDHMVSRVFQSVRDVEKVFVQGDGCPHCHHTATIGRVAISETIVTDPTLMQKLRSGDRVGAQVYWRETQGGVTMISDALNKIGQGIVDPFMAEDVVGPLNLGIIEFDHTITSSEVVSAT